MGHYTKFYGVIELNTAHKEKFIDSMKEYKNQFPLLDNNFIKFWEIVYKKLPIYEIKNFTENDSRSSYIPFSSNTEVDFCNIMDTPELIENNLIIYCDFKNYNKTIQAFVEKILPLFSNNYYLYKLYEEDEFKSRKPTLYAKGTISKKEVAKYFNYTWLT